MGVGVVLAPFFWSKWMKKKLKRVRRAKKAKDSVAVIKVTTHGLSKTEENLLMLDVTRSIQTLGGLKKLRAAWREEE